eukprot:EG_transcript_13806
MKGLFKEATKDIAEPTPGYLLHEIVEGTHRPAADLDLVEDLVVQALKAQSPHVVAKGLQLVKELCTKGHETFRERMKEYESLLQCCVVWSGPLDPLCGDAANEKVRDLGSECINLIWNQRWPHVADTVQQHRAAPSRIVGYGMTEGKSPPPAAVSLTSSAGLLGGLLQAGSLLARTYTSAVLGEAVADYILTTPAEQRPHNRSPVSLSPPTPLGYCPPVLVDEELTPTEAPRDVRAVPQPLQQFPFIGTPAAVFAFLDAPLRWADDAATRRLQRAVWRVVAGGELQPSWCELQAFAQAFHSAGGSEAVGAILNDLLEYPQPWQLQLKALRVIAWVLQYGTAEQRTGLAAFYCSRTDRVQALLQAVQLSVAEAAQKVLDALSEESPSQGIWKTDPIPSPPPREPSK